MTVKRINLALQGGGAHGAFTWGVLDRLLDDDQIEIAGISGTSAGALNGAALKAGLVSDGTGRDRDSARENLDWLWTQVAGVGDLRMTTWFAPFAPATSLLASAAELSPAFLFADLATRAVSPYAYGPYYSNPLDRVVRAFRFDKVCADTGPKLFVSATNVRTGKIRVFEGEEIGSAALLASACLPTLFQAVEIADPGTGKIESYWDGGYSGNPALYPLFLPDLPADTVIVNINPIMRPDVPKSPQDIQNRINEISFNSSLLRELRAINFVKELIADGRIVEGTMRNVLIHMISDDDLMTELSVATKVVPSPVLLTRLKAAGREAADRFLAEHREDLNVRGTVDLEGTYS